MPTILEEESNLLAELALLLPEFQVAAGAPLAEATRNALPLLPRAALLPAEINSDEARWTVELAVGARMPGARSMLSEALSALQAASPVLGSLSLARAIRRSDARSAAELLEVTMVRALEPTPALPPENGGVVIAGEVRVLGIAVDALAAGATSAAIIPQGGTQLQQGDLAAYQSLAGPPHLLGSATLSGDFLEWSHPIPAMQEVGGGVYLLRGLWSSESSVEIERLAEGDWFRHEAEMLDGSRLATRFASDRERLRILGDEATAEEIDALEGLFRERPDREFVFLDPERRIHRAALCSWRIERPPRGEARPYLLEFDCRSDVSLLDLATEVES